MVAIDGRWVVPSAEGTEDAAQGTAGSSGSSGVVIDRLNARRTSPAQCPKFRRVGVSMQACPCCTAGGPIESRSRNDQSRTVCKRKNKCSAGCLVGAEA